MNYFLLHLLLVPFLAGSPPVTVTIKAQSKSLTTTLFSEDAGKTLIINSNLKPKTGEDIVIHIDEANEGNEWDRSFIIFDKQDAEVARFKQQPKKNFYKMPLKSLLSSLKKDNDYTIYTIAIPKDPEKAAVVRVRRVLICTIRVK